jgi:hypothetical protein
MKRIIQSLLQLKRHLRRWSAAASESKKTLPQRQRLPLWPSLVDAPSKAGNRHGLLRSFGDAMDASTIVTFLITIDQVTATLLGVLLISRLGSSGAATLVMKGRLLANTTRLVWADLCHRSSASSRSRETSMMVTGDLMSKWGAMEASRTEMISGPTYAVVVGPALLLGILLLLLLVFREEIMILALFLIVGIPKETEIVMIEDRVSSMDFVAKRIASVMHAPRRLAGFAEARASIVEAEVVTVDLHRAVVARGGGADRIPAVGVLLGVGVAVARRFQASFKTVAAALCLGVEARFSAVSGQYLGVEARCIEVAGRIRGAEALRVARNVAAHRAVFRRQRGDRGVLKDDRRHRNHDHIRPRAVGRGETKRANNLYFMT